MKSEDIIYNIRDEKELDDIFNAIRSESRKEIKNIGLISIIITIAFCATIAFVIIILNSLSNPNTKVDSGNGFLLLIFASILICILLSFYNRYMLRNFNGRTSITIPLNTNITTLDIDNILKNLYYKKIKYNGNEVYYAFKTRFSLVNASSIKRYLSYSIKENELIIEVWKKYGKKEKPVNYGQIGRYINIASLYDLKVIISNINSKGSSI